MPGSNLKKKDYRYGERCNHLLLRPNSNGEMAGQIRCRCGAMIEIINGKVKQLKHEKEIA